MQTGSLNNVEAFPGEGSQVIALKSSAARDRSFTTLAARTLSCRRLCMSKSFGVRLPHAARGRLAGLQGQKLRRIHMWTLMALPALL